MGNLLYISGLDLGKLSDPSAYACLQRTSRVEQSEPDPVRPKRAGEPSWMQDKPVQKRVNHYALVRLQRFDLGTKYDKIVDRMVDLYSVPPLQNSILVPDKTGVGEAVCDELAKAMRDGILRNGMVYRHKLKARLRPITITAGAGWKQDGAGWRVAKKELASVAQVILQQGRLKIAGSLEHASTLTRELENFVVKITPSANDTYEAIREGAHDDLVLAVAMALWLGENACKEMWVR